MTISKYSGAGVHAPLVDWTDEELAAIGLRFGGKSGRGRKQREDLRIHIPKDCNLYHMTVGRALASGLGDRLAISLETQAGDLESLTFLQVDRAATMLAARLRELGVKSGDFVGLHTGMDPLTPVGHMAVCKLGATAVTLSQLYGPDSLAHALNDCRAKILLTGEQAWSGLRTDAATQFPYLERVLVAGSTGPEEDLAKILCESPPADFVPAYTHGDDAALLMYTSGSTGMPKGILHGHRVLAAYRPSINLFFNLSLEDGDAVFWSPADWAWVGGLLDLLFPAWMAARPVVTSFARFDADWAFEFMARHKVTHTFLTPTAIKRLAQTSKPRDRYDLALRVICTGGEALAADILTWTEEELGITCNEFYGLTEVNHLIGNCKAIYPRRPGSMGVAYPGHDVRLVDDQGRQVNRGEIGEIVTSGDAPTRFLGYLNNAGKEEELRLGSWLRTHDLAVQDEDGYFWYKGRQDDLIKSSGYRIGPAEVEACLIAHPFVAEAAVIGKPDKERGQIVKAFVRLVSEQTASDELARSLRQHVRERLAVYKAPREIDFVKGFEMTSSGKINRKALRLAETD